jgi:SNF2 family DNA or RNA helicase
MKFIPHDYQKIAIEKIIDGPAVGLFLEMGLGKTVSALTAIQELLYDYFDVSKVLVIAPLRVTQSTWSGEIEKWDHLQGLRLSKVLGSEKQRVEALHQPADIYIINRENTEWLVDYYGRKWPFDMVVIDELSSFKNPRSKRFRALRKVRPLIKRIVGLTGTPAPNGLIDLWSQIYLLDQGERLGKTLTGYRNRYFDPGRRNQNIVFEWIPKPFAEERIYEKISDICVSMKAEDWLQLPGRIDNAIEVELPEKAKSQYKQLEKDLILPLLGSDVTAANAAVLTNKLLQMANGAIYDEFGEAKEIHDAKLEALEEVVEAANGKPVLVVYSYRHDLDRIKNQLKKYKPRTLDSDQDVQDWNAGKTQVLLLHPASGGHGLNLQTGGNIIVWFGLTWGLEYYQQANARLYRQGQIERVIVHHIVAKGTMDEEVLKALTGTAATQNDLMEAVKAKIEQYKGVLK